ncbi:MAG: NifU family protein [Solirubrobacteraceae bacterium MAG38_C4-C5]|nr:NifU family protein [Candidatus Siliceabacter maunaloa]
MDDLHPRALPSGHRQADELVGRVEGLLEELESLADPMARDLATTMVTALLDLYGEGLRRVLDGVGASQALTLAGDDVVEHLLLLHGLHPVPVEERVQAGLEEVRPYLDSHGGNVELVSVRDGVVLLQMQGSCEGCPASAMTLKLAIEEAVFKAAPDVAAVEAEGAIDEAPAQAGGLLQIEMVGDTQSPSAAGAGGHGSDPSWAMAGSLPQLSSGGTLLKEVSGHELLFLRLDGAPYAYRPRCPGCEDSLEGAPLTGAELTCPACGHRYDARRAGRCLDQPQLHLEPVPLLTDDSGLVRVAVG